MTNTPQRIDDIIAEGVSNSAAVLTKVFQIGNPVQLAQFQKIMAAMRGLPPQAQEEIVIPLIQKVCSALGLNPAQDHAKISEFSDIIALSIQDATGLIIENMEHQQKAAAALRTGRGSMLQGL